MYREILVPTDGSKTAERTIDHALDLAETYDAWIHALYVIDTNIYTLLDAGADMVADALGRKGDAATRHVHEAAEEASINVQVEIVTGTAYHSIRKHIDGHDIDLIVMDIHGRTGLSHYLLGDVTECVVRTSPVPVLTIRLDNDEENEADAADKTTDASADAEE